MTTLTPAERTALLHAWPWPKEAATTEGGFGEVVATVERIIDDRQRQSRTAMATDAEALFLDRVEASTTNPKVLRAVALERERMANQPASTETTTETLPCYADGDPHEAHDWHFDSFTLNQRFACPGVDIDVTTILPPACPLGYPREQLEQIIAERLDEFGRWMRGQTVGICEGQRYDHDAREYRPTECADAPHGVVIYPQDVARFMRGGGDR